MLFVLIVLCLIMAIVILSYKSKKSVLENIHEVDKAEADDSVEKIIDYQLYAYRWKQRISHKLKLWIEFDYINKAGIKSKERSIELNWINKAYDGYLIEAFCERDQMIKSFYLEKMSNVVSQETGEVLEYEDIIKYANWDSEGASKNITIIELLFLLAKVDGRLKPRETKIIKSISNELGLNEEIFDWLKKFRRIEYEQLKNTLHTFLEDNTESRKVILNYIKQVFEADEDISEAEQLILQDLDITL